MSVKSVLQRYGTPFTTGLFLVSTVSGVALFLHVEQGWFHSMHEILSLVLLVPIVLHLWRNWTALKGYFRRPAFWSAILLSLAAGGFFIWQAETAPARTGNPAMALVRAAQNAPLSSLAPLLAIDETQILERLAAAGVSPVQPADSLAAIAERSGRSSTELLAAVQTPVAPAAP